MHPRRQIEKEFDSDEIGGEYKIVDVSFSVSDPEEILRQSVVNVNRGDLYSRGFPNANAVNDLRMGSVDRRLRCSTCKHSAHTCMGHTGHIDLALPVPHWLMIDHIIKVLRCTCFFCARLIVDKSKTDIKRRFASSANLSSKRLAAVSVYCKKRSCVRHAPQPEWKKQGLTFAGTFSSDAKFESPEEATFAKENGKSIEYTRHIRMHFEGRLRVHRHEGVPPGVDDPHRAPRAAPSLPSNDRAQRRKQVQGAR